MPRTVDKLAQRKLTQLSRILLLPRGGAEPTELRSRGAELSLRVAAQVKLGLGINTGAGVKDGSVGFKALGCGLQVCPR